MTKMFQYFIWLCRYLKGNCKKFSSFSEICDCRKLRAILHATAMRERCLSDFETVSPISFGCCVLLLQKSIFQQANQLLQKGLERNSVCCRTKNPPQGYQKAYSFLNRCYSLNVELTYFKFDVWQL